MDSYQAIPMLAERRERTPNYKIQTPRTQPLGKRELIDYIEEILGRQLTDKELRIILKLAEGE